MPVENSLFRSVLVEKPTEIPSDTLPQTFEMEVVFVNPSGENEFEYVQKRVIHKAAAYHHTMR